MKKSGVFTFFYRLLLTIMLMVGINGIFLAEMLDRWYLPLISVFAFVAANAFPSGAKGGYPSFKFRMIAHGSELLLQFLITTLLSSVIYIQSAFQMLPDNWVKWALCLGGALLAEFILFWNGIISVYCTSVQLGIKHRFIGIICGFIPIVNLFCLGVIIKITMCGFIFLSFAAISVPQTSPISISRNAKSKCSGSILSREISPV